MSNKDIGRLVWFYKHTSDGGHKGPLAAFVAKANDDDGTVNLTVLTEGGATWPQEHVPVVATEAAPKGNYCVFP